MAYVIGQACIGTKDTACIDACPTDSIHGYQESVQLFIDPATCIDCDACAQACPVSAIFPGDQVPADQQKFTAINADFFKAWDRSKSLPELKKQAAAAQKSAAGASGTSTVASEDDDTWTEVEGWQEKWTERQGDPEDPVDRQKRYGRVRTLFETPEKIIVRVFLPEKTPNHPFLYRYDLPKEVSQYDVQARFDGGFLKIAGKMKSKKLAKLSGMVNSFPDRFSIELPMSIDIEAVTVQPKGKHVVDVVATKRAA